MNKSQYSPKLSLFRGQKTENNSEKGLYLSGKCDKIRL